ncbi:hypothetical protein [Actinopolymorpha rutila]|uniref:DUF2550 domain-containing protein n=1 Tax=Actinopolymorpha rutila TaxID=446787 RepID=A0A852ZH83_9ACTN|nr:hypothetical protein [Actinopolymorpha rutila]NYH88959.1 hypothetical protein [Actinopolymorpha rutila]
MLWLLTGAVLVWIYLSIRILARRRRIINASGVFRCKVRSTSWGVEALGYRWPRRTSYAVWAHDVLVVYRRFSLNEVLVLECRFAEDLEVAPSTLRRLGPCPLLLRIRLDDGAMVEVAAPRRACSELVGPYIAAQLHPSERG